MRKVFIKIITLTILAIFVTTSFTHAFANPLNKTEGAGVLKEVRHRKHGNLEEVSIFITNYEDYNIMRLSNPDRIVVDFNNVHVKDGLKGMDVNGNAVKSIRYSQFTQTSGRVVLDVVGNPEYKLEHREGLFIINVIAASASDGSSDIPSRGGIDREIMSVYKDLEIFYKPEDSKDRVAISMNPGENYNILRLTGPDRIVIDITNMIAPSSQQIVNINSNFISDIRYAKFGDNMARVVLDTIGQLQFDVNQENGKLVLDIASPSNKNITYRNNGDRVYFTLNDTKLTEGGEYLKELYRAEYDSTGLKYVITFPSNLSSIGAGTVWINDGMLESVIVSTNDSTQNTTIQFNAKQKLSYQIITRPDTNETIINLLNPVENRDKLVVIDAGHGGTEPGAVYGSIKEKDLNLDIAIRLNELLKKEGVKTFMIREDDSYIGLYERAYIANNLNADLFLSIHNNAMGDPNFGGTMTLYYPKNYSGSGFSGKRFAEIIQGKLLGTLGTTDRKIIERPNLVVLKATTMPAIIAEVAFLTNSNDRLNLQQEAFRQKAAQALCDGVLQSLSEIR